jgi:hypothetical protein
MTKFKTFAASAAIASVMLPGLALAHNDNKVITKIKTAIKINQNINGSVSAVGTAGFDLKKPDGSTYNVLTASSSISNTLGLSLKLSDIKVNDKASIKGDINGSQVTAKKIVITPANTHRAEGGGKVTAINGNNITVEQNHGGIMYSFTVQTNASTTITNKNNAASQVTVGSNVKVSGLWDEVANLLMAMKIRIK